MQWWQWKLRIAGRDIANSHAMATKKAHTLLMTSSTGNHFHSENSAASEPSPARLISLSSPVNLNKNLLHTHILDEHNPTRNFLSCYEPLTINCFRIHVPKKHCEMDSPQITISEPVLSIPSPTMLWSLPSHQGESHMLTSLGPAENATSECINTVSLHCAYFWSELAR